jgi:soluble lytic murein transglycosylase-like protein
VKALLVLAALAGSQPAGGQGPRHWDGEVAEASARFGIPAEWIRRVIEVESKGRATRRGGPVVSPAGAIGLMQLMPGTWSDMRDALGLGRNPNDPRDNILAGTAYLRAMYDRFGYPGLFAAYNAGPARYASYLAGRGRLPRETRAYLAKMTAPNGHPSAPSAIARAKPADRLLAIDRLGTSSPPPVAPVWADRLFVALGTASPASD